MMGDEVRKQVFIMKNNCSCFVAVASSSLFFEHQGVEESQ